MLKSAPVAYDLVENYTTLASLKGLYTLSCKSIIGPVTVPHFVMLKPQISVYGKQ